MTQQSATSFVGRTDELALLTALLDDRSGAIIRVSGEAGVGKSRLVTEAIRAAGVDALIGVSSPASLGRPFDLLLSTVEPAVRRWTSCPSALTGVRGALQHLLRGVAPALGTDDLTQASDPAPTELMSAGIALLRHLDPEVIWLEDLHWADVESLRVMERLVSSPDHPCLIVTYRTEELGSTTPGVELVRAIETRNGSHAVHLQPFDGNDVQRFIEAWFGSPVDSQTSDQLHSRTGGSPFFLEQVLATADSMPVDGLGLRQIPSTLTEAVRLRLDDLDDLERDLLQTGAVLGSRFEFDLLQAAIGVDEGELIRRLRRIVDRQLLVETELDVFKFRHELVRESLLSSLLGRELRRLHERAWQALSQIQPDDYGELARHAAGAGRLDELVAFAPQGVRHYLKVGSSYQALLLAESALEQSPDHLELHELAARAGWLSGSLTEARRHAESWRRLEKGGTNSREAEALAMLGRIAYELDEDAVEEDILGELEAAQAEMQDPESRARVLAWLAQHNMLRGNSERAASAADEAIAIAEPLGLEDLVRLCMVEKGSAYISTVEHRDEGKEILRRVAKQAEAAGEFVSASRAWHNLLPFQDPGDVDVTLEAMRDAAERGGFDVLAVMGFASRKVELAITRADLHDALRWIGRVTQIGARTRTGAYISVTEVILALEASADGEALGLAQHVEAHLDGKHPEATSWVWAMDLALALREGNTDAASALLANPGTNEFAPVALAWALRQLKEANTSKERVRACYETTIADLDEDQVNSVVWALVSCYCEDADAEKLLRKAIDGSFPLVVDAATNCDLMPFGAVLNAECHLGIARIALRNGDKRLGRTEARLAAELLKKWPGVRRDEALALARHGKVEATTGSELTGRELEVVRLLATGMTNGEIAERLYIARKTVSTHVSHILAKRDMASRTEVAAWAVREGIADG